MNIVSKLPTEIQTKIFLYLSNPEADVIRNGKETFTKKALSYLYFCKTVCMLEHRRDDNEGYDYERIVEYIDMYENNEDESLDDFLTMKREIIYFQMYYDTDKYNRLRYADEVEQLYPKIRNLFYVIRGINNKDFKECVCDTRYIKGTCEIYYSDFEKLLYKL